MNKRNRNILIVIGTLILLIILGIVLYFVLKKSKDEHIVIQCPIFLSQLNEAVSPVVINNINSNIDLITKSFQSLKNYQIVDSTSSAPFTYKYGITVDMKSVTISNVSVFNVTYDSTQHVIVGSVIFTVPINFPWSMGMNVYV